MATFRKIHVSFWKDPFVRKLTPEQKYFYLYLMTNPQTKQCGIYEIDLGTIAHETGYNLETVSKLIKFFEGEGKIRHSAQKDEIAIKNWLKYNDNPSPQVKKLVSKELSEVKDTALIQYLYSIDTQSLREEEREIEKEEERVEKPSPQEKIFLDTQLNDFAIYDAEKLITENQAEFERICMSTGKKIETAKLSLRKYHLWLAEKEQYPKGKKAIYAGFEKWLLNEKNIPNGQQSNSSVNTVNKHNAGALELLRKGKEEYANLRGKEEDRT